MKALTDIPYAREAAELLWGKEHVQQVLKEYHPRSFLIRVFHFENRYRTIDALLSELDTENVLELCAGFSFRGLNMAQQKKITYIDTDLPGLIEIKQDLVQQLEKTYKINLKGSLQTKALNVLDEETFLHIAGLFPAGPLTIVNEGLLMYLGVQEKQELCRIIRGLLQERGGQWITGDIYIKKSSYEDVEDKGDAFVEQFNEFLEEHRIEENKFESFDAAAVFFEANGFRISKRLEVVADKLSSLKILRNNSDKTTNGEQAKKRYSIRQTWLLEAR